jgi:hypothetical protein
MGLVTGHGCICDEKQSTVMGSFIWTVAQTNVSTQWKNTPALLEDLLLLLSPITFMVKVQADHDLVRNTATAVSQHCYSKDSTY